MDCELVILQWLCVVGWYETNRYKKGNKYFQGRNCNHDTFYPWIGCKKSKGIRRKSHLDKLVDFYQRTKTNKIFGTVESDEPCLYINDPHLIRQITVEQFDNFMNYKDRCLDYDDGGLRGHSLSAMKDQKWEHMRSTLSPAFTGSLMFQLVIDVAQQAISYLKSENHANDVDIGNFFERFANDIIASVAFGIQVDSLEDENHEFTQKREETLEYRGGRQLRLSFWYHIKFIMDFILKFIPEMPNLCFWKKSAGTYFKELVLNAMNYRMKRKIVRHDMINILMQAKGMYADGNEPSEQIDHEWTDIEIVAQSYAFLAKGFSSTISLMCFAAHEIMENNEIQERLRKEVDEVKESLNGGHLTYEACNKLKYMDMVLSETLRKWPTNATTNRLCTKTTTFENPDGLGDFTVNVGDCVVIPIAGLQRDAKYFPYPMTFNPERFSEKNINKIQQSTYIPFGAGRRACIGSKFALMEAKAILFYMIGEFELEPSYKSTIPMELGIFGMQPKNGFWMKFIPRFEEEFILY